MFFVFLFSWIHHRLFLKYLDFGFNQMYFQSTFPYSKIWIHIVHMFLINLKLINQNQQNVLASHKVLGASFKKKEQNRKKSLLKSFWTIHLIWSGFKLQYESLLKWGAIECFLLLCFSCLISFAISRGLQFSFATLVSG